MSSIVSKLADEIKLHGSIQAYVDFRDKDQVKKEDPEDIPYFPDPEVVPNSDASDACDFLLQYYVEDFKNQIYKNRPHFMKGEFKLECYRTACSNRPAVFFNHSTRKYYCTRCAHLINDANPDYYTKSGHDLCQRVTEPVNPV